MATGPQARRAANLHADELASYPNVVGIGTRRVAGDPSDTAAEPYAVAVYVSRKVPVGQLADRDRLPEYVEIVEGRERARVPVIVVVSGVIAPEGTEDTEVAESYDGFTTE